MNRYLKLTIFFAVPTLLLASGGDSEAAQKYFELTGRHTDFAPRVFNFILLAGLLYYLLATPIKSYLKSRSEAIAKELEEIEAKREAARDAKIKAQQELENAKLKAADIISDAKAQLALIKENIQKQTEQELANLEQVCRDNCAIEKRKMIKETTIHLLNDNISKDDIPLDASKIVDIVTKEVA